MSKERDQRKQMIREMIEAGEQPFKYHYDRENTIEEIVSKYKGKNEEDLPDKKFKTAGRITDIRNFGSIVFLDLRGSEAEVQIVSDEEGVIDLVDEKLHSGDIVGVEGSLKYTDKGEFSIKAESIELLTKGVRQIPSSFYGVEDPEKKYGDRPLYFITNMEARDKIRTRSKITSIVRNVLEEKGFIETETPTIQEVYGGANAKPFETYVEDNDMDAYLRISPELYLKRLIVSGFDKVFEVSRCFRNESIDTTHNPEFTQMEAYQAYADYEDMMDLTEEIYVRVAEEINGSTKVNYQGVKLDFSRPWRRMSVVEAIEESTGLKPEELTKEEIKAELEGRGHHVEKFSSHGEAVMELFECEVEPNLIQPTFIIDHPEESTPLCKDHREKEGKIERFEPFVAGMEIGNAYTELRNPLKQRELFEKEQQRLEEGDEEAHPLDMDFVDALELGMPPTGGLGLGIDRMAMLFTDSQSIKEVLSFPMVKKQGSRKDK